MQQSTTSVVVDCWLTHCWFTHTCCKMGPCISRHSPSPEPHDDAETSHEDGTTATELEPDAFPAQALPPEWSTNLAPEILASVVCLSVDWEGDHVLAGTGSGHLVWIARSGAVVASRKVHSSPVRAIASSQHHGACSGCEQGELWQTRDSTSVSQQLPDYGKDVRVHYATETRIEKLRVVKSYLLVETNSYLRVVDLCSLEQVWCALYVSGILTLYHI